MPRMKPDVLDEFLRQAHVGVVATLRRDGRPYTVPVWWLWKPAEPRVVDRWGYGEGAFWLTGTYSRVWCKQLMADPRVSLCIEASAPVSGHVGVDGIAEALQLPAFDIWPVSRKLAEKYVGRGDPARAGDVNRFFANMQTEPRLLFRIAPQVVRAIDMRIYRGKRADRDFQERRAGDA